MNLQTLSVVAFYFSRAQGQAADGYVDLDGLLSPTGECVFDADQNGYIFTCEYDNTTAVMYQEYFDGDYTCSGTGNSSVVTEFDYECTPVGFMKFNLQVGSCSSGGSGVASTALVSDMCHESSLTNASTIYTCDSSSFTIETYSDSDCTTMIDSTTYTDCYYIGDIDTGDPFGILPAYMALDMCVPEFTTMSPTSGAETSTTEGDDDDETTYSPTTTDGPTTTIGDVDLSDYHGGYFNYSVLGIDVPLPIDLCVLVNIDDSYQATYGKVTCNNAETQATLRIYSTDDCTGTVDQTIRVDVDSGTFDCDSTIRYASLALGITSSCPSTYILTFATGRCFPLGNTYTAVTCDESTTDITLYQYADEDCTEISGKTVVGGDSCEVFDDLEGIPLTVYYTPEECVQPERVVETSTTKGPDSDRAVGLASTIGFTLVTIMVFVAAVVIV